jgi:hypothetical protein
MIINRRAREKRILLQYEVELLKYKVEWMENHPNGPPPPPKLFSQMIREDGWDISYLTLKKKYENN